MAFPVLGGDEEDRTLDLTDANRTLSQLSYAPIFFQFLRCEPSGCQERHREKLKPFRLLSQLSYRPVAAFLLKINLKLQISQIRDIA